MLPLKLFCLLILANLSFGEECGKTKVVLDVSDGEDSQPGQWPWLASLYVEPHGYVCGASIISKKFLLGAAHCVHPKGHTRFRTEDFHALLERYQLNDTNDLNSMRVTFSEIFLHPDWDSKSETYDGDVALFKMSKKIKFTNYIQPICLPSEDAKIFDVEGTVAGYGLSETSQPHENRPKHVKIKSVVNDVCLSKEPTFASMGSSKMFCAGEQGKNPCRGDGGGPFMVKIDGKWMVNGILSTTAHSECHENDFVLFTQVPKFLEWIREIMKGRKLECRSIHWQNNKTICSTESLKILTPNLRVTSIRLDETSDRVNEIVGIYIYHAEVHYLPDLSIAKEKIPNFKKLMITDCGLKELDRSKLALLPQLTELDVRENNIQEFPEDIFDDVMGLGRLIFAKNQVKILPQKLLWQLSKLKKFDAQGNQIEAIPVRFFEMNENIEEINLWENKISRIEIDLRSLPKLKEFFLRGNRCIDEDLYTAGGLYNSLTDKDEFQRLINEKCH